MMRLMKVYRAIERTVLPGAVTFAFLGVSLSDVSSYVKGVEFRSLMAQVVAQVSAGVADAVLQTLILASFGVLE